MKHLPQNPPNISLFCEMSMSSSFSTRQFELLCLVDRFVTLFLKYGFYVIWEWQSKTEKAPCVVLCTLVSGWSVDVPTFITQTPPKMSKSWFQNHKGVSSTTYILLFSASYQHIIQFFTNGNSTATNYRVKLEICVEHIMCAWHT